MSKEIVEEGTQELVLDNSNKVSFPGFPYKLEAINEQILVSIDVFKSGYECKECHGKGKIKYECSCVREGHHAFKYSKEQLEEIETALGPEALNSSRSKICPECVGDPSSVAKDEACAACKGVGATILIPKTAEQLPVTGVVVSMGRQAKKLADFKIGDRVLFGFHAGSLIPTKAGIMLKRMDWFQVWLTIEGADELGAFDFLIQEDNSLL